VPTSRRRFQITESNDISRALALAAKRWPKDARRPAALIQRLIGEGANAVTAQRERDVRRRHEAVARHRGAFAEAYPPGYLDEERRGWTD
jgi:hypothetical protein